LAISETATVVENRETQTLEETSTTVKDKMLESKTEVPNIVSTSQQSAIFEADLGTTQSPEVTDVLEMSGLVTGEPNTKTSRPDAVLLQSDAIVFPAEAVPKKSDLETTTLQAVTANENTSEGPRQTEDARPRAIQAIE